MTAGFWSLLPEVCVLESHWICHRNNPVSQGLTSGLSTRRAAPSLPAVVLYSFFHVVLLDPDSCTVGCPEARLQKGKWRVAQQDYRVPSWIQKSPGK